MKKYFLNNKNVIFVILLFFFLQFLVSFQFELGTDEAHYVLYGKHLALSYFDHPPLVGWLQKVFFIFNYLPIQVTSRLPSLIIAAVASFAINHWLILKNYSSEARLFAIIGLHLSLLFTALSYFFLPDTILLLIVPLLSLSCEQLIKRNSIQNWILFAITLGLAGLTKYTAVLFLIPILFYWYKANRLKDLLSFRFYFAVLIALIIISPVLIWNLQNDFISFKYQSGHVVSFQNLSLQTFFAAQVSLIIASGFFYFFCFPKPKNLQDQFDFLLMTTPLVFFSFFALFGNFLPHWTAPFFILAIPWGLANQYDQHKKIPTKLKLATGAAAFLFILIQLELSLHLLPFKYSKDLHRDIQGWQEFTNRSLAKSQYPLAVTNWTFGSRVKLYSELAGRPSVTILDHRIDQFDIWSDETPVTNDYLMLVEKKNATEFLNSIHCQQQNNKGVDGPLYKNEILVEFELIECLGFSWKNN